MERRYKLSQRQYEAIAEAQQAVDATQAAHEAAIRHANQIALLINDFLGVSDAAANREVDPKTRELVVQLPDPVPAPPSA